jgi:uncharacterized membrane protein YkvA (DUF1232 family)
MRFRRLVIEGLKNPAQAIAFVYYLPKFFRLYTRLFRDPRVPWHLKLVVVLALIYLLWPLDIIPDFLFPGIGQIDDVMVVWLALRLFLKHSPQEVVLEHVREIEEEG